MKCSKTLLAVALSPCILTVANAYYSDYNDNYDNLNVQQPAYTSSYDANTGNSYQTTRYADETQVEGSNANTGSQWNTTIQSDGDMNGVDKSGNTWSYDQSSGYYQNSDGTTCSGHGQYRTCE